MHNVRARLRSRARKAAANPPTSWPSGVRAIPWRVLAVIALGGVIGALARQGIWAVFPHHPGAFDWPTLAINVTGSALIGALMTVAEARSLHRLVPPFLGPGLLGGFTTFSTYIVGIQQSIDAGAPGSAAAYLTATLAAALVAVWAGRSGARVVLRRLQAGTTARASRPHQPVTPGSQPPQAEQLSLEDAEER